jgi:3-dehydrosphinganine reductase
MLAQQGAHVSIVARNKHDLEVGLNQIEASRQSEDQVFRSYSFSLSSPEDSQAALQAVMGAHGVKS